MSAVAGDVSWVDLREERRRRREGSRWWARQASLDEHSARRAAQLREVLVHRLDRNGEADALRAAYVHGVDADDRTILGDQGAATIARIDGRVGLQEALLAGAAVPGEDARRDAVGQPRGVADRVQALSLEEPGGAGPIQVRTVVRRKLKDREIPAFSVLGAPHPEIGTVHQCRGKTVERLRRAFVGALPVELPRQAGELLLHRLDTLIQLQHLQVRAWLPCERRPQLHLLDDVRLP